LGLVVLVAPVAEQTTALKAEVQHLIQLLLLEGGMAEAVLEEAHPTIMVALAVLEVAVQFLQPQAELEIHHR
jgi:hypothetical protein